MGSRPRQRQYNSDGQHTERQLTQEPVAGRDPPKNLTSSNFFSLRKNQPIKGIVMNPQLNEFEKLLQTSVHKQPLAHPAYLHPEKNRLINQSFDASLTGAATHQKVPVRDLFAPKLQSINNSGVRLISLPECCQLSKGVLEQPGGSGSHLNEPSQLQANPPILRDPREGMPSLQQSGEAGRKKKKYKKVRFLSD